MARFYVELLLSSLSALDGRVLLSIECLSTNWCLLFHLLSLYSHELGGGRCTKGVTLSQVSSNEAKKFLYIHTLGRKKKKSEMKFLQHRRHHLCQSCPWPGLALITFHARSHKHFFPLVSEFGQEDSLFSDSCRIRRPQTS